MARRKTKKGNLRFNPSREGDRPLDESAMLLSAVYFVKPQQLARMAICRGLLEMAAEKNVTIPLMNVNDNQSAAAG
jgi:hypothetical protein